MPVQPIRPFRNQFQNPAQFQAALGQFQIAQMQYNNQMAGAHYEHTKRTQQTNYLRKVPSSSHVLTFRRPRDWRKESNTLYGIGINRPNTQLLREDVSSKYIDELATRYGKFRTKNLSKHVNKGHEINSNMNILNNDINALARSKYSERKKSWWKFW